MPKSRKPRKASRKTSRKGKKCPPGCVKKTLKRSRKSTKRSRRRVSRKASRKRRSVKRKASRKRKSVKRKASRKRRSVKRKVSRKRKSAKRKTSRKRKSAKRKTSRKRKSAKRKTSRKRKSAKRKASRKRKSAKRKASRKRKSAKRKSRKRKNVTKSHKFRFWKYIPFSGTRSDHLADQKIKEQQKIRGTYQTYKEYLQPLIKNYYPGHPQSLYYAVAKYYIEKIAHAPRALSMLDAGKPIPLKFPHGYSIDKYKKVNKLKIGQAYRLYYEAMHKAHLEKCTGSDCNKSRSQFVVHHINQHTESAAKKLKQHGEKEGAARVAAKYQKCLKVLKQMKQVPRDRRDSSGWYQALQKKGKRLDCDSLPEKQKQRMKTIAKIEARTAERAKKAVKRGKWANWARSIKKKGAAVAKYQESDKYDQAQATIPWARRSSAAKLAGCRKAAARGKKMAETPARAELFKSFTARGCPGIINSANSAPAPKPTSLF